MDILKFGWLPDLPDFRDYVFSGTTAVANLPPIVDLRANDAPIYNQGSLGSCTGNSIAGMFQFVNKKTAGQDFIPSRLFIYYNERKIMGTVNKDSGAYIRDGIKSIAKKGVCKEITWPYDVTKFKNKPVEAAFAEALNHQAIQYQRIDDTINSMKQCIADGFPFVFGFSMYESFISEPVTKTGIVPMPNKSEKSLGGHAVMAIGYDEDKNHFIIRNSWGTGWGDKGYFYMPYDYMKNGNLADDFWTLRKVEV
jgi:hypothetical protein